MKGQLGIASVIRACGPGGVLLALSGLLLTTQPAAAQYVAGAVNYSPAPGVELSAAFDTGGPRTIVEPVPLVPYADPPVVVVPDSADGDYSPTYWTPNSLGAGFMADFWSPVSTPAITIQEPVPVVAEDDYIAPGVQVVYVSGPRYWERVHYLRHHHYWQRPLALAYSPTDVVWTPAVEPALVQPTAYEPVYAPAYEPVYADAMIPIASGLTFSASIGFGFGSPVVYVPQPYARRVYVEPWGPLAPEPVIRTWPRRQWYPAPGYYDRMQRASWTPVNNQPWRYGLGGRPTRLASAAPVTLARSEQVPLPGWSREPVIDLRPNNPMRPLPNRPGLSPVWPQRPMPPVSDRRLPQAPMQAVIRQEPVRQVAAMRPMEPVRQPVSIRPAAPVRQAEPVRREPVRQAAPVRQAPVRQAAPARQAARARQTTRPAAAKPAKREPQRSESRRH